MLATMLRRSIGIVSAIAVVVLYLPVALSSIPETTIENVVLTSSGLLSGLKLRSWTGKEFWSFRGVPYAEPPIGNLRFKPPVSKAPWKGRRSATRDGKICIQPDGSEFFGSADEDCLYLNVYTKNYFGDYPVIVFFHPGAFYSNTGASNVFGPEYLMDHDIILVTVNYRLDALGFLSTGDKTSVGNYGMKDQVEALRWVKKNIKNFGGNPNKVTIAGYSAGSSSTFLHMMSPMSKGLFHNVIAMSGGLTSDWVVTKDPLTNAKRLAKLLNCSSDSSVKIVECFKKLPATQVNSKFSEQRVFDGLPMVRFGPVVEPDLGTGEERFLTDDPVSLIKKKQFHHVPVVTGVTEYEFIGWFQDVINNDTLREEFVKNFDSLAPQIFGYPEKTPGEAQKITNSLKEFYFKNKTISSNSLYEVGQLYSDFTIIYGEHTTTKLLVEYNEKPVYSYLLKYNGRYGHVKDDNNKTIGPSHHDDLIYLFNISIAFPTFKESDPEAFMVKTETTFWKNFATKSDPTPDNLSFRWTPVTKTNNKYLNIDSQLTMKDFSDSPFVERMKLWERLFPVK